MSCIQKKDFRQKIIILIVLLGLGLPFFPFEVMAESDSTEDVASDGASLSESTAVERAVRKYADKDFQAITPDFNPGNILKDLMSGNMKFDLFEILKGVLNYVLREIRHNLHIFLK